MSKTIDILWILAIGLVSAAADPVVITDSGSTNTAGFRIEVRQSGEATFTRVRRRPMTGQVPSALLKRFLADLDGAKPFSELPRQGCMKSASFGTTLVIEYQGQKTPDLRCGDRGNAKLKALIQDYQDIKQLFHDAPVH